jgi:predicted N-acetyltransferase YhbS
MDYTLTKGRPDDYEDIIDFANYVFNLDFPSMLPKLYKNHKETSQYHHIIKEHNRIKAVVGSFPLSLKVLKNDLKVCGIGTVAVHRYSRGSGYMKLLMDNALQEIKMQDYDLAVLWGQRQRYEYWGFTPCGIVTRLSFNSSNIKHAPKALFEEYSFVQYDDSRASDLDKAISLHNSQSVHSLRERTNFIEISSSWHNNVYFIYSKGEFSGYLCCCDNGKKISEILLLNPNNIDRVIISYMKQFHLENLSLDMPIHRSEEIIKLSSSCESYSINSCANIYIINYDKVIKAFMDLKNSYFPLCDGILKINIEGSGCYKIMVKYGVVTVEKSEEPHDISLTHLEGSALLFSHQSFINSTYNFTHLLVKDWFPLPLFYPNLDNV